MGGLERRGCRSGPAKVAGGVVGETDGRCEKPRSQSIRESWVGCLGDQSDSHPHSSAPVTVAVC